MYTPEEFARAITLRGLPGRKVLIEAYIKSHPKELYDEDDLIDYAHSNPTEHLRRGRISGKCADGQDMFSPSNERNGGSDPLWEINAIYRAMDRDAEKRGRA